MKLKRHRDDVRWLKSYPAEKVEASIIFDIARKYHRLILAFECGNTATKLKHIERVLRDAE